LLVTARTSAFHFKGQDIPVPEIAAALGVAHVVEGSVRRDGDRIRVTAQLIRADDGFHLWSEIYDDSTDDAFAVQTDIAEKIASALDVVLDEDQLEHMHSVGLRDPEAYIAFQKGIELYERAHGIGSRVETLLEANEWFEKALELAPELSDAYAYHADYYAHLLIESSTGVEVPEEDLKNAIAQLTEDHTNASRYADNDARRLAAAYDLNLITGKWRGISALMDEIFLQNACFQPAWMDMTTVTYGRQEEYLELQLKLVSCAPLAYSGWRGAAHAHNWMGNHQAAIDIATKGYATTSHSLVLGEVIMSNIAAGHFDQAETIINRDVRDEEDALAYRTKLAAARGDAAETMALLEEYIAADIEGDEQLIVLAANAGNRGLANRVAAEIDTRPHGHILLMQMPIDCKCGKPFDLEQTPNLAKLIDEANLPWPPISPIDWPLKDW